MPIHEVGIADNVLAVLGNPAAVAKLDALRYQAAADALLEERRALVAEIARINGEAARELPRLRIKAADALETERKAEKVLRDAVARRRAADAEVSMCSTRQHAAVERLEARLRGSADSVRIEAFLDEVRAATERERRAIPQVVEEPTGEFYRTTQKAVTRKLSTGPSIAARLAKLREMEQTVRLELPLLALTPQELEAKVAELRSSIPPLEAVEVAVG